MRQLAADTAKEHSNAKGLLRPKAAYETATMLVDASQHAWKVLYLDSQASTVTGTSLQSCGKIPLCNNMPAGMHNAQLSCTCAVGAMLQQDFQDADTSCPGDLSLHVILQAPMATTLCESSEVWYEEGWLYAGISVSMAGASTFWGLFSSSDAPGDHSWKGYANQTENSLDFMLHNMQRRGSSNHTVFSLAFT